MPKVLVTGGTGFIALHCVKVLLERGHEVKATVRDPNNAERTAPLTNLGKVTLAKADLHDSVDDWVEIVKGCDYVLHTASPFFFPQNEEESIKMVKDAVTGTKVVLEACSKVDSIKGVVVTSSCVSVGFNPGDEKRAVPYTYTEKDWCREKTPGYTNSKVEAEKAAWNFVMDNTGHAYNMATICPSAVSGPNLGNKGTSVAMIEACKSGKFPGGGPAWPWVDVRDVALAHVLAMEQGENRRFIVNAGFYDWKEMANHCGSLTPEFEEAYEAVKGLTLNPFDGSLAEKALGLKYTDLKQSVSET